MWLNVSTEIPEMREFFSYLGTILVAYPRGEMPNFRELLQRAKSEIVEVTTEEAENLIGQGWVLP